MKYAYDSTEHHLRMLPRAPPLLELFPCYTTGISSHLLMELPDKRPCPTTALCYLVGRAGTATQPLVEISHFSTTLHGTPDPNGVLIHLQFFGGNTQGRIDRGRAKRKVASTEFDRSCDIAVLIIICSLSFAVTKTLW